MHVLNPAQLPDVEAVAFKALTAQTRTDRKWLWVGGIAGGVVGASFAPDFLGWIGLLLGCSIGAAVGYSAALKWIKRRASKVALHEVMPELAQICGGAWHEQAQGVIPPGNPAQYRNDSYHGAVVGALPGGGVPYGVFNYRTVHTHTDSDGHTQKTETDYVIAWLDVAMPVNDLELKHRSMHGGGALGRFMDRVDSRVSDQNVLEMESEQFNRMFKVEVSDSEDQVTVRRMFSPQVVDALVEGKVPLADEIIYHNGRIWIVDYKLEHFTIETATQTLDYMIYRAQMVERVCHALSQRA